MLTRKQHELLLYINERLSETGVSCPTAREQANADGGCGRRSSSSSGFTPGTSAPGSGIILLAALSLRHVEAFAVTNAVKNLGTGMANIAATAAYFVLAPVDVTAAAVLGAGAPLGRWLGPQIVRVVPERPLRIASGLAGIGLAGFLMAQ